MPDISTKVEHHRALPYGEVPCALASVRASDAWIGTRLFFEFLVLTAVRTNEARGARWSEIDFAQATWSVPFKRMKEREAHSVPLSSAALTLERALDALHFDPQCDRLFGVGDLVNRGPHSAEALEWLERRFEAVVLGNHDRAALCWFEARRGTAAPTDSQWLDAVPSADHRRWGDALAAMPLAITIATPYGTVGVVHADVPHRVWSQATSMFESGDASAVDVALLGLDAASEAIRRHQAQSVEGLTALVHGHDAGKTVRYSANRWNIDTGAGLRRLNRLTLLHVNARRIRPLTVPVDEGVADCVFPPGFRRPPRTGR